MLPSNPLHHLLMTELGRPVVATSGNNSDEPICTDEREALGRLKGIADVFLVHNRPIVRHIDDSIVRIMMDHPMVLRRARGYAPLPVTLTENIDGADPGATLAVGAHLKNTVALAVRNQVFLSQHIGDLETEQAHHAFRRSASDLPTLYDSQPVTVVADQHPDYSSTRFAVALATSEDPEDDRSTAQPGLLQVQHHLAHFFSCIADNRITLPALGVAWDGTGYGSDGSIWGGEFFRADARLEQRVAHLEPFELPGGDAAIREPRRAAYAMLRALRSSDPRLAAWREGWVRTVFTAPERKTLDAMLERGMNSPKCTSIGRLFDAIASMIGVRHRSSFEGQAAMELEFAIGDLQTEDHYELPISSAPGSPGVLRWLPLVERIVSDVIDGVDAGLISARFHNSLAEAIVQVADQVGEQRVALTGGCFQNSYLTRQTVTRLREAGRQPFWHHQVPPNDGGIALGQVVAEARHRARNLEPRVPQDRPNHQ
jgi:hydrogenase maturation protein HypF